MDEVDLIRKLGTTKVEFKLVPELWNDFSIDDFNLNDAVFCEIKFLNEDGDDMHEQMNQLPSDTGGIYFFYIRTGILKNSDHLVYIGRAKHTDAQNLKKRCRSYFQKYPNERPKINWMIREWGPYLYLRYISLTDNTLISKLEENLINALLPPFNEEIPNKTIKRAVSAFT